MGAAKANLVGKEHLGIGDTIRHFRKKRGLTLQQVADNSGLSPSFISLAERGKATPSLVSLINLAQALDIAVDQFLEVSKRAQPVHRKNSPDYLEFDSPVKYVRLGCGVPGQRLDGMKLIIPAGFECPTTQRDGESFYYVLEGTVKITIDGAEYELTEGDSAHVLAHQNYVLTCDANEPAVVIWTGTSQLTYGE